MSVFRMNRNEGYTVMSNYHLRDMTISLKAKGLLSQMFSLREDWDYSLRGLAKINKESIDAISSAVKELEAAGYIVRHGQLRGQDGRLSKAVYDVYEKPVLKTSGSGTPCPENPDTVKSGTENPTQLNNKIPNTQKSNTEVINYPSINHAAQPNGYDSMEAYRDLIHANIDYDCLVEQNKARKSEIDEIVDIMLECVCSNRQTLLIGKDDIPQSVVKSRFLKINFDHIEYILEALKKNTSEIRNIKAYLKTVIYNAPTTISNYYTAEVNHDLNG